MDDSKTKFARSRARCHNAVLTAPDSFYFRLYATRTSTLCSAGTQDMHSTVGSLQFNNGWHIPLGWIQTKIYKRTVTHSFYIRSFIMGLCSTFRPPVTTIHMHKNLYPYHSIPTVKNKRCLQLSFPIHSVFRYISDDGQKRPKHVA